MEIGVFDGLLVAAFMLIAYAAVCKRNEDEEPEILAMAIVLIVSWIVVAIAGEL